MRAILRLGFGYTGFDGQTSVTSAANATEVGEVSDGQKGIIKKGPVTFHSAPLREMMGASIGFLQTSPP